ncbi:MAG: flavin reductase family protein [Candidatus Lokiarchaeota archaeon]|nr:flavin reductase family protein [Candidatus Lokiarchaeota archaeon]
MKVQIDNSTTPIVSPAVVISVGDWEKSNLITLAWVARVVSEPPVMSISIRPSRFSHSLIEDTKEYVINVPFTAQARHIDFCGTRTGKKVDKWKELGLTREKAQKVGVPIIKEFPINIECHLIDKMIKGTHHIYFGEVLAVDVDQEIIENGKIVPTKQDQIAYIARNYYSLRENPVGKQGFSLKS